MPPLAEEACQGPKASQVRLDRWVMKATRAHEAILGHVGLKERPGRKEALADQATRVSRVGQDQSESQVSTF